MIQEPRAEGPIAEKLRSFDKKPGSSWTPTELDDCCLWLLGRLPEFQDRAARVFAKCPALSREDAADALTDFFMLRLKGVLRDFDPNRAPFFSFVMFCLTRYCKGVARQCYERQLSERYRFDPAGQEIVMTIMDASPGIDPLERLENWQAHLLVQKAVSSLKKEYQQVLRLRLQEKSYEEIAYELEISIPNVKTRIHRARHELKASLGTLKRRTSLG